MMLEKKTTEFLEVLSSSEPVPGGGGAAAAVGAMGAALGMMVSNLTIGKKKYADVEDEVRKVRDQLDVLQHQLVGLADADADAFEPLSRAYGLPKETEEQKAHKEKIMEQALYEASIVPIQMMETILDVMQLLEVLGERGSRIAISDVGAGVLLAEAALQAASLNVFINTKLMKKEEQARELNQKADSLIQKGSAMKEIIYQSVLQKIR